MLNTLLAVLFVAVAQAPAEIELRWRFKEGETFQQQTRSQIQQVVKVGDQELKQDLIHTTQMKFAVKKVEPDGSVVLEQTIESMKATTPEGAPAGGNNAVLNQLQGSVFTIKLGPDLKVQSLEGYEELLKRLAGDDPSIRRVVQSLLSLDQLKNVIHQSFAFLPNGKVKPDAAWERESQISLGPLGGMHLKQSFQFVGQETKEGKTLAKITFQPAMTYTPPKPDAANPEMSIIHGEIQPGPSQGVLFFDVAAGRLESSELKLQLKGKLTVKLQGKEVPLTFEQSQTIEIRLVKP